MFRSYSILPLSARHRKARAGTHSLAPLSLITHDLKFSPKLLRRRSCIALHRVLIVLCAGIWYRLRFALVEGDAEEVERYNISKYVLIVEIRNEMTMIADIA